MDLYLGASTFEVVGIRNACRRGGVGCDFSCVMGLWASGDLG